MAAGVTTSGSPILSVGLTLNFSNPVTERICFRAVSALTLGGAVALVVSELRRPHEADETGAST